MRLTLTVIALTLLFAGNIYTQPGTKK